jgi:hypothetical protein
MPNEGWKQGKVNTKIFLSLYVCHAYKIKMNASIVLESSWISIELMKSYLQNAFF